MIMNDETVTEAAAEALVRLAPELNKGEPKFKPGILEAIIRAAELDVFTWLAALQIIELGLKIHPLLVLGPVEEGDDPVINPANYQLAI